MAMVRETMTNYGKSMKTVWPSSEKSGALKKLGAAICKNRRVKEQILMEA
jgi:hypothetical protein